MLGSHFQITNLLISLGVWLGYQVKKKFRGYCNCRQSWELLRRHFQGHDFGISMTWSYKSLYDHVLLAKVLAWKGFDGQFIKKMSGVCKETAGTLPLSAYSLKSLENSKNTLSTDV